jgi:light-harvesting protein B-800-850 alpha chain
MIYGKLWCVVRPSVGIPVIIGAVAVGSFAVHLSLLTHTDWVPRFLNGGPPAAKVSQATPATAAPTDVAVNQQITAQPKL